MSRSVAYKESKFIWDLKSFVCSICSI